MKKMYSRPWLETLYNEMPEICSTSNDEGQDLLPGEGGSDFGNL